MRVALVGYGKMGRAIEEIASQRDHHISAIVSPGHKSLDFVTKENTDIAIEFTSPAVAKDNVTCLIEKGIPTLCGTTGWLNDLGTIKNLAEKNRTPFLHSSNFSIGVNIFFMLNRYLAEIMNGMPGYNVSIKEIHHIHKKDAPSGTAIKLAQDILDRVTRKKKWKLQDGINISAHDLIIEDIRTGEVPGTHYVTYTGGMDSIEITHTAHSRQGFAEGAVMCAEWLIKQEGNKTMDDFISAVLRNK